MTESQVVLLPPTIRQRTTTADDYARRFPVQPAAALAPKPPTSTVQRWTGHSSTLIPPPQANLLTSSTTSDDCRSASCSARQPTRQRMLTGYPSHTTQRASQRLRQRHAGDVEEAPPSGHHVATHDHDEGDHSGEAYETNQAPPPAAPAGGVSQEIVSFTPSPVPVLARNSDPEGGSVRHASPRSSPRGPHPGTLTYPPLRSPSNRPPSNVSMLYAPEQQFMRTNSRGGALSANTVARVERSEQRKVLLEQQLALERAYWNTKSAFQGLRAQAEQHIYARELTALWTERTDKSPYWTDQAHGLRTSLDHIEQWRLNPLYVKSPQRHRRLQYGDNNNNTVKNDDTNHAALIAAFPQSVAWAATAACAEGDSDHLHHRPLDHRIRAAPLVPQSSWRTAIPMYKCAQQPLTPRVDSPPSHQSRSPKKPSARRQLVAGSHPDATAAVPNSQSDDAARNDNVATADSVSHNDGGSEKADAATTVESEHTAAPSAAKESTSTGATTSPAATEDAAESAPPLKANSEQFNEEL